LVKSLRGPGGGYRLAKSAEETNIADIVLAVDEPLRATRCGVQGKGCMLKGERCITHDLWEDMGRHLHSYLASVSLDDLVNGRFAPHEAAA
jgi:Rrf2 family iron-sulfur cluster assembly transcriptional regulator